MSVNEQGKCFMSDMMARQLNVTSPEPCPMDRDTPEGSDLSDCMMETIYRAVLVVFFDMFTNEYKSTLGCTVEFDLHAGGCSAQ